MTKILSYIFHLYYECIYVVNRIILNLMGVKFGRNLQCQSIFSISKPTRLLIGNNTWIGRNCSFYAENGIIIGNDVMISKDVSVISSDHSYDDPTKPIRCQGYKKANSISIGNNVWLGEKSIILNEVNLGDNTVVGAGSVVTKNFPSNVVIAGNPARIIRHIPS